MYKADGGLIVAGRHAVAHAQMQSYFQLRPLRLTSFSHSFHNASLAYAQLTPLEVLNKLQNKRSFEVEHSTSQSHGSLQTLVTSENTYKREWTSS